MKLPAVRRRSPAEGDTVPTSPTKGQMGGRVISTERTPSHWVGKPNVRGGQDRLERYEQSRREAPWEPSLSSRCVPPKRSEGGAIGREQGDPSWYIANKRTPLARVASAALCQTPAFVRVVAPTCSHAGRFAPCGFTRDTSVVSGLGTSAEGCSMPVGSWFNRERSRRQRTSSALRGHRALRQHLGMPSLLGGYSSLSSPRDWSGC